MPLVNFPDDQVTKDRLQNITGYKDITILQSYITITITRTWGVLSTHTLALIDQSLSAQLK